MDLALGTNRTCVFPGLSGGQVGRGHTQALPARQHCRRARAGGSNTHPATERQTRGAEAVTQRPASSAASRDGGRATGQQLHDAKPSCGSKDSAVCVQRSRGQHSTTPTAGPRAAHSRQPRSLPTPRGSQHSQQNQSEPAIPEMTIPMHSKLCPNGRFVRNLASRSDMRVSIHPEKFRADAQSP